MPEIPTFIILEGLLHESGGFELLRAFEDTHAERESRFDEATTNATATTTATVAVSLLDAKGQVLRRVTPRVHFPTGCTGGGTMAAQAFVRAALARDDEARRVEVRVNGRVAFDAGVAEAPPDLKVSAQAAGKQVVPILVDVEGEGADVRIIARVTDGRRLTPAVRREGDTHAVDLASLEGLGEAEIIVEASRACRTARVVAATVALPEATVHGVIVEPRDEALWPWGRRGSLIATLSDRNGRPVAWNTSHVAWRVDGEALEARDPLVAWQPERPGVHRIELVHEYGEGRLEVLDERMITVAEPTPEQKEWLAAVAQQENTP